ncbi:hypothetical protein GCM10012285_57010 [Streptomyces kronopolitis]|uniref:Secreted protein n=1 Tax=Streptomyces kronopolitis TaxID=1612435 RepID=A0ABQ2JWQ8_9ACTN|nr:hypothetical protein [Streptomyces kronopolitis]GGN59664.1 hypothetical protein GCM10012285_57010 [Streptomyces kronopolitis]
MQVKRAITAAMLVAACTSGLAVTTGGTAWAQGGDGDEKSTGNSVSVNAQTARNKYGIPEGNYEKFRDFANKYHVVIDVRPSNASAPNWLDKGAKPKPEDIKSKTVNDLDCYLGAEEWQIGLVGYFKPQKPNVPWYTLPGKRNAIEERYRQRLHEFKTLAPKIESLSKKGKFIHDNKLIWKVDEDGQVWELTGDHDLYNIHTADGEKISPELHDEIIGQMKRQNMAVAHGAHRFWQPQSSFDHIIFEKIVKSHQPGGEPLLRFEPNAKTATLTWDTAS